MIQLFQVTKSYDASGQALKDITLKIARGEFLFITGSSGAGKTTLLKIMFGAEPPSEGQIIIDGMNYVRIPQREIPELRRRMGFVFQDFKLIAHKTVYENVALGLKVMGVAPDEERERVAKALAYLKIQHRANFRAGSLSGGEQQRTAIARAFVKEPQIILADEPTGNLDPALTTETIELFKEANAKGTTVVVATHDSGLIERYGARTVVLDAGRMIN